jgi:hypothetical protein
MIPSDRNSSKTRWIWQLKKPLRVANHDGLAEFLLADHVVHTHPAKFAGTRP